MYLLEFCSLHLTKFLKWGIDGYYSISAVGEVILLVMFVCWLKKKKTEGLTAEEKVEQAKLREEYIEGYRRSVRHHIEGIKIVDEDGNDVTPEKLRQVQREKGLSSSIAFYSNPLFFMGDSRSILNLALPKSKIQHRLAR